MRICRNSLLALCAVSTLSVTSIVNAASFNCDNARTAIEHMICGNDELSRLDVDMAAAYWQARTSSADRESLRQSQSIWLNSRNRCDDIACLKASYQQRIAELRGGEEKPARATAANRDTPSVWSKFGQLGKPDQQTPSSPPVEEPSTGTSAPSSLSPQDIANRLLDLQPEYLPDSDWEQGSMQALEPNAAEQRAGVRQKIQIVNTAATQSITLRIYESRDTAAKAFAVLNVSNAMSSDPDYDTISQYSIQHTSRGSMSAKFAGAEARLDFKSIGCMDKDIPVYIRTAALHEILPITITAAIKEASRTELSNEDVSKIVKDKLVPLIHSGWIHIKRALEPSHR